MFRRVVIAIACVCLFALGACAEPITITFGHWAQDPAFIAMIDAFHKSQDKYRVELQLYDWARYGEQLAVEAAAGLGPDVINLHGSKTPPGVWIHFLLDLTNYFNRDKATLNVSDFLPNALAFTTLNGIQFAMPYMMPLASSTVIYSAPAFTNAGLAFPSEDWTWDDLSRIARVLTKDENGDGNVDFWGAEGNQDWRLMHHLILSAGGWYYSNQDREINLRIDPAQQAMQWMLGMVEVGAMSRPGQGSFNANKSALKLGQAWGHVIRGVIEKWYKEPEIGAVMTPKNPRTGKRVFEAGVMQIGFGINANSKHPEAAWEFIKFATGPNGWAKCGYEATGSLYFLPARRSLVMKYFAKPLPNIPAERADPMMKLRAWNFAQATYATSPNKNLVVNWPKIEGEMYGEWGGVLAGKYSIPMFIDRVEPKINAILQAE